MDRFIGQGPEELYQQVHYLKSNMDRFIAKNLTSAKINKKVFKIQYG